MAHLAMAAMAAGTLVTGLGQAREGQAAHASAIYAARAGTAEARAQGEQYRYQAGQTRASAQREAMEERRLARIAVGRARALAAASGGGVSNASVDAITGRITDEGDYRADVATFEGEERARGLEYAAQTGQFTASARGDLLREQGRSARQAGLLRATGTILGGGSSLFEKYG